MFSRGSSGSGVATPGLSGNVLVLLNDIASAPQQRRLTIVIGDVQVVLDASNRELMRIISVTPDSLAHSDAVSIAARDDDSLAGQLEKLGGLFAALTYLEGKMTLTAVPAPLRYSTKLQGFSKNELSVAAVAGIRAGAGLPKAQAAGHRPAAPEVAKPQSAGNTDTSETSPVSDLTGTDTRFFDQLSTKCESAFFLDTGGKVLRRAGNWENLHDCIAGLLADLTAWRQDTKEALP